MTVSADILKQAIIGIDINSLSSTDVNADGTYSGDDSQSLKDFNRISLYASLVQSAILALTGTQTLPDQLSYIVVELTLEKFNKAHNEGQTAVSEAGVSLTFDSNSLSKYYGVISKYTDATSTSFSGGKAVSW